MSEGKLDDILARSTIVRRLTLRFLTSIGRTLTERLLPLMNKSQDLTKSSQRVQTLTKDAAYVLHDDAEARSDDASSGEPSIFEADNLEEMAEDLKTDIQCLMDLGPLFKFPVLDVEPTREPAAGGEIDPTDLRIAKLDFSKDAVTAWRAHDERHSNWPVVYVLDDGRDTTQARSNQLRDIYVGESLNTAGRLRQHLETPARQHLKNIRVIFGERFNKSVCLDLESYLIKMLAGDGANRVLNWNNGITEARYFQREMYREGFRNIFERLRADGVFTRGVLNAKFATITRELFGDDDTSKTQLDCIRAKSRYQIFLLDVAQSVRPANLLSGLLSDLVSDAQVGLAGIIAGYVWEWKSKKEKKAFDMEIGDTQLCWNSTTTDWQRARSIHTVQGYDLNYVGVIIGLDLGFDLAWRRLFIDRDSYFDKKGKENSPTLGRTYSDDDLLRFITQIYTVPMTRGIRLCMRVIPDCGSILKVSSHFSRETM
ncbi:hypothetical protein QQZ08_002558 [Neonectria magnoliae]|uniref:GIY-YIG domain-containing protein n=1 Tax=Neonectria magnoliae TaxID=2732573 RepID=A0ABR1IDU1_9HYPO